MHANTRKTRMDLIHTKKMNTKIYDKFSKEVIPFVDLKDAIKAIN